MLTAAEIAAIRTEADAWLPSVARPHAKVTVSDGAGGVGSGYVADAATMPCRLAPIAGGEASVGGGGAADLGAAVSDRTTHVVTLTHDAVIEEPDRIDVDGVMYEVTYVRKRPGFEFVRRVEVRELV